MLFAPVSLNQMDMEKSVTAVLESDAEYPAVTNGWMFRELHFNAGPISVTSYASELTREKSSELNPRS